MAVAYQSVSTVGFAGKGHNETITITKPSGTVEGDLLVAHLVVTTRESTQEHDYNVPAGWTELVLVESEQRNLQVMYKVAGASEGANYSFTHVDSSGTDGGFCAGAIYRIDGQGDVSDIQQTNATASGSGSFSFANTVTPKFADSLLLFLVHSDEDANNTTGAASSFAITTDNPTWTERYDQTGDLDGYFGSGNPSGTVMAGATASRTETTATGNSSVSISNMEDAIGVMLVIPPVVSTTVTPSEVTATATVQAPTVTGTAVVTPGVVDVTATAQAPTIVTASQGDDGVPSNPNKSDTNPTWLNPDKS